MHVCTRYQRGGSERRVRDLIMSMPEIRHDLVVGAESDLELARAQSGASSVSALPSLKRAIQPASDLAAVLAVRRMLAAESYDLLITHQSKAGVVARVAAIACGAAPPIVQSLSMASFGPGYGRIESMLFRTVERVLAHRTTAVCAVGRDVAERMSALGVPRERVHIVRSGVPLPTAFPPRPVARRSVADRWGFPPDRPLVVYVGSLEQRKNVLSFPDFLAALALRLPTAPVLLVVGDGPLHDELARRMSTAGLDGQCILTGHLSEPASVLEAILAADLMLLLSRTEGLPQVLVQAAAVGTPFVAYDVEGVRELLELGAKGDTSPLGDLDAVVESATRRLRCDAEPRELSADLSSWATEVIRESYRTVLDGVLAHRISDG